MLPLGFKITTEILWRGALFFAGIDIVFIPLLIWRIKTATFRRFKWALVGVTAIYWCALWAWAMINFWDSIYHYVFPAWAHWFIPPVYGLLSAAISLLLWWLALRLRGNAVLNFCLLGGLWGMITHLMAVAFGIVSKPPPLQGAAPVAAVIIAIFEFMFYWCVILSVTTLVYLIWQKLGPISRSKRVGQQEVR
jgi:hypothetical protein